jgi:predicted nucleic acid-binding Zn ribbon protein
MNTRPGMWYYRPVAELFRGDCGPVYDAATRSIERPSKALQTFLSHYGLYVGDARGGEEFRSIEPTSRTLQARLPRHGLYVSDARSGEQSGSIEHPSRTLQV